MTKMKSRNSCCIIKTRYLNILLLVIDIKFTDAAFTSSPYVRDVRSPSSQRSFLNSAFGRPYYLSSKRQHANYQYNTAVPFCSVQYKTNNHDNDDMTTQRNKQKKKNNIINTKKEKTVVILYHKPAGVITSHSNNDAGPTKQKSSKNKNNNDDVVASPRKTVYEDIMSMKGYVSSIITTSIPPPQSSFEETTNIKSKLHAIGRLDVDTTGLLLLTNDGALIHHVTNPTSNYSSQSNNGSVGVKEKNKNISKTYQALIMGHHTTSSPSIQQLQTTGVNLGVKSGGMTKPADNITILSHPTPKSTMVSITISEGKNRQIRKMFHSVGSGVMSLHRCRIGEHLTLGDLKEGQWRVLSEEEVMDGFGWKIRVLEEDDNGTNSEKKRRKRGRGGGSRRDGMVAGKRRRQRR